jgi:hypothetical protein
MSASMIVILFGLFAFLEFFFLIWFVRRVGNARYQEAMQRFPGQEIIKVYPAANFFGQQTKGVTQIRGQGVLVLTAEQLFFLMWLPKRVLVVPLSLIEKVEIVDSFLYKTKFRPLLRVDFRNENGTADAAAWLVDGVKEWKEAIKRAKGQ